jgi:ABC-type branched-subunit amino acid transport system ATPase component/predicted MFS family arabinose efflux permease
VTGTGDEERAAATHGLVQAVLDAEAAREEQQSAAAREPMFADELLPGVGGEQMTLRQGVALGSAYVFVVLALLQIFDGLEGATLSVLAPNIRNSFHVSDGVIVFVSAASGAFLVLGALPMGWLADRYRRGLVIGWASAVFAAMVFASGLAVNAFALFWARFGVGVTKANNYPVHGSLIADTYPIQVRGRVNAAISGAALLAAVLSPALVGGIAAIAGGSAGWRWSYFVLALPMIPLTVLAFRLPEPPRGQHEMIDVLGEVVPDDRPAPISVEAAFARLNRIATFRSVLLAFAAMGFGLFTQPVLANLYLDRHFHLGSFGRGVVGTVTGAGVLVVLPFAARRYDALFRQDPARALRMLGLLILPVGLVIVVQYSMPNAALFTVLGVIPGVLLLTSFTMVGPVMQSVVPYRLRGLGSALGSIYVFFVGATGGALLAALFVNAIGPKNTVLLLSVPTTFIGGLLVLRGATSIKKDLSLVVADLREELDDHRRQQADPRNIPVIQVNSIDFSYGNVQVLFDVGFDVRRGEVLALLGTNGAGKSTILRVIAGVGTPSRGVVRLNGRNITFVSPEQRARLGIQLLPGGRGVFTQLTVLENLEMGAFIYRHDRADVARRIERVMEPFPALAADPHKLAGSLSGGQQQMLALARVLLHDPELLLIDELSLGLAPLVVQELIAVIDRLRTSGLTIVVVEQSLNVAASISDRAVFLEKGQVRFDGPTRELVERDDLARAVFLGGDGG